MSGDQWADIAAANARLLTQALAKLAAAERELEAVRPVVEAAEAWYREWGTGNTRDRLTDAVSTLQRQRDAAGRGGT